MKNDQANIKHINAEQLNIWLQTGEAILVDVREPNEYAEAHIAQALSMPLTDIKQHVSHINNESRKIVFQCLKGTRGEMGANAAFDVLHNHDEIYNLTGGIEAWKNAGYPTIKDTQTNKLPIMRQVMITAGTLILAGSIAAMLGMSVGTYLTLFVGAGLLFAGLTGWCGMAMLLQKMPWNT